MKVIIVEDEFLAQQELTWLIKTHSQMEIVGTFDDGLDVLKFLQHNRVDAIFLDINIPSLDGVLLAQNINQFAHKPFIVFVTAWKEHAVEAFELEAFDYILKPYQESRIVSMLQKLEAAWQQQTAPASATPTVRENDTINLVKDTSLVYILAMNDLLRVARTIVQREFDMTPFLIAAVFYLAMTFVLTWGFKKLEAYYGKYDN